MHRVLVRFKKISHIKTQFKMHFEANYYKGYERYKGIIMPTPTPTEDMVTDTLTKALPSMKVKHFASALGLAKA